MGTFPPTKLRYAPPPINRPLELLQTLRGTGVKPFVSPHGSRLCLWEEARQKTAEKVEFFPSRCQGYLRSPCRGWRRNPRRGQMAERAKGVWGRITSGWEQGPTGNDARRGCADDQH